MYRGKSNETDGEKLFLKYTNTEDKYVRMFHVRQWPSDQMNGRTNQECRALLFLCMVQPLSATDNEF